MGGGNTMVLDRLNIHGTSIPGEGEEKKLRKKVFKRRDDRKKKRLGSV